MARQGGIPRCEAELAECTINLTDTEGRLQVCEDALAQCQTNEGQAFPATGQTSCWYSDEHGSIVEDPDCTNPASAGQDGDIQAGASLTDAYTDTGLTITDNNTQLEWMKQDDNNMGCGSYPDNLDKDCTFIWDEAFTFVANLNANNHGGHADWRVPNVKELQSIVNYQNFNPAVSEAFHDTEGEGQCVAGCTVEACSCTDAYGYRSSTSGAGSPSFAWGVWFSTGFVAGDGKGDFLKVRAVRGGL